MPQDENEFSVEIKHGIVIFTNKSKMNMIVSIRPIPPKRKYHDVLLITPGTFKILDSGMQFDLSKVSLHFEPIKKEEICKTSDL